MGYGSCLHPQRTHDVYVDPSAGVNGSGTKASPYNVWSSVPSTTNRRVAIKRGTTMRGGGAAWAPKNTGWTIDAYGVGAPPTYFGSVRLSSFTLSSGSIYYATCASLPNQLIEMLTADVYSTTNIKWLTRMPSLAAITAAGQWYWDAANTRVYLRASDSGNPSTHAYEACIYSQALSVNSSGTSKAGLKLRNLRFVGGKYGVHFQNGGDGSSSMNCDFWASQTGLFVDGTTSISNFKARGNFLTLSGADGAVKFYADVQDSEIIDNTIIHAACDPNAYQITPTDPIAARMSTAAIANDSRAGIWIGAHGDDLNLSNPAGRTRLPDRIKIFGNDVDRTAQAPHAPPSACPGTGIWLDGPGTDIEVAYNRSHDGKSRGINCESGYFGNIRIHHNFVWNYTDVSGGGTGILVSRSAHEVTVAYNSIWNCWQGFWAQSQVNFGVTVGDPGGYQDNRWVGNIVKDCIYVLKYLHGAANAPTGGNPATPEGTGNRIDHNMVDTDHTNWGQTQVNATTTSFGSSVTHATLAAWTAVYNAQEAGGITAMIQDDPEWISLDPTSRDFMRIGETSPARHAGVAITGITPAGVTNPDLGALPYDAPLPPPPPVSTGYGSQPYGATAYGDGVGGYGVSPYGSNPYGA